MALDKKEMLVAALKMALDVARATPNLYDDIVVRAACAILDRIFGLQMED